MVQVFSRKTRFQISWIGIVLLLPFTALWTQTDQSDVQVFLGRVEGLDTLGLDTGDILFCQAKTFNGYMTQIGTCSPFTHSAMIVREEDGSLWLTHATDNDYHGQRMAVKGEPTGRSGVIYTRLKDIFVAARQGTNGYYKRIWIRRLDDTKGARPDPQMIKALYEAHKQLPFESSNWRFILTAFDLRLFGKDWLSVPDSETIMCSEYLSILLDELHLPVKRKQAYNEISPKRIYRMIDENWLPPLVYRFEDGMYRLQAK